MIKKTIVFLSVLMSVLIFIMYSTSASSVTFPPENKIAKEISFKSNVIGHNGTFKSYVKGTIIGLKTPPKGRFKLNVKSENFKQVFHSELHCTIVPMQSIRLIKTKSILLAINYDNKTALGFYTGGTSYPTKNLKVFITNGNDYEEWNTLNCLAK